ncbi:M4 family metallopeptidase [Flavobacterium sp. HSC-61S13]|uniref:M4 family metallopeptidase n=1 Tax=Flavobacterium sp. HSC-61S13 TaxID=2910963 RepID=UPI00209DB548|nr:M4 family metallopeptidase [Flavobacterium sp. HSC-61S13]MCP1996241.1 Zn-dependent metalloprotease [Flavobacterium sp. HSC-61S13]
MRKQYISIKNFRTILYLSFLIGSTTAFSYGDDVQILSDQIPSSFGVPRPIMLNGQGSFSIDLSVQKLTLDQISSSFNSWLGLDSDHSFIEVSKTTDALKFTHTHFQHLYKGIPIEGELILVHTKANVVESINGQFTALQDVSVTQAMGNERALEIAKATLKVQESYGDYPITTTFVKFESPRGIVETRFVKKVRVDSFEPLVMANVYVDVATGEVVKTVNLIHDADVNATAMTYYKGTQNIIVDSTATGYRLRDNGRKIETYNAELASYSPRTLLRNATDYTSVTTSFSNNPALDAHWGMEMTYDYYKNVFNRTSYDNKGGIIKNYYDAVIFETIMPQAGYPNNAGAFPDPYNVMVYGRGDNVTMGPVVGLDVAGHEFTHIVIDHNGAGGLDYLGESGALNESFADIFGTAIEFYVNLNPNWVVGEDVMLNNGSGLRDMSDPKRANNPNTYKGQYWINTASNFDNGGVHINSGVQNFWFYLLSEGGSGSNDLNNNYNVNGIGIEKAEKIAYRNLTTYLTSSATFLDAYNGSLLAAKDLYGEKSNEYEAVLEAWYAVGIGEKLSTDSHAIQDKLKVYPNPAKGTVFVNADFDGLSTLEVYDLLGKRVIKPITLNKGENSVNIQSLSNGVYFLKFNINGQSHSEKLMINN